MKRITLAEADALRRTPGATVALFLTDRCPVGCDHCSVRSRPDSPTITDWPRFAELVEQICEMPALEVVAITGGEPFAERRGLTYAVARLHDAGKIVVVFTSGYWARHRIPSWIGDVLRRTATVYLSTDSFHRAALSTRSFPDTEPGLLDTAVVRAANEIGAAGCHLILQVLDEPGLVDAVRTAYPHADVSPIRGLPTGLGARHFAAGPLRAISAFGPCGLLNSPTVRYDGTVTACCNESVIMGGGPAALRTDVQAGGLEPSLRQFATDPVLRIMARFGPGPLKIIADGPYRTVCEPCWFALDRVAIDQYAAAQVVVLGA